MNLFQKYGIKEVADVVFYTITPVGDEEFYTPVLFLDTLKVSTLEKAAEKVEAKGGKGNKKLITWNFGKEITLNLEDALFSPASISMIWGGKLNTKLSDYTSAIVKCNIANKYGEQHFSTKAYPSPALTDREWDIVFEVVTEISKQEGTGLNYIMEEDSSNENVAENRMEMIKSYFGRTLDSKDNKNLAMPENIIQGIISKVQKLEDVGYVDVDIHDIEVIDRMEKCIVKKKTGQKISISEQKKNLFRYYKDDKSSSYTIFYDAKTMLPLLPIENGEIQGWDDKDETDEFTIKMGTIYYKWTRTVKYKESEDDGILGKTFVIDAETFPEAYRIVGETYIRNQKTGKDQRYQFTIFKANVSSDTSVTLEAEGDPTTFSMQIDVLTPPNDIMMELKQYNVEEDTIEGGTRIVPQQSKYTYTQAYIEKKDVAVEENNEIY